MRASFARYGAGRGAEPRLLQEMISYCMCVLDETRIEAVHRDVSHISRKATASSVAFRAGTLRLNQNLRFADSDLPEDRQWMQTAYKHWKSIPQTSLAKARAGIGVKSMTSKNGKLFQWLYRHGMESLRDWGFLKDALSMWLPPEVIARAGISVRLKLDYMRKSISSGECYTLPDVGEADIESIMENARSPEEAERRLRLAARGNLVFVALELRPALRKQVRTAHAEHVKAMTFPIIIQDYEVCTSVAHGPGQLVVCQVGLPHAVDIARMVQWPVFRHALRVWQRQAPDVRGHVKLAGGTLASDTAWDFGQPGGPPAVVVLDTLVRAGWHAGKPARKHLPGQRLVFEVNDPLQHRNYLQCLARLPELVAAGMDNGLPSGEHPKYYDAILRTSNPVTVPTALDGPGYARWLLSQQGGEAQVIAPGPLLLLDEDEPEGDICARPGALRGIPPTKRRRLRTAAAGGEDIGGLLWRPVAESIAHQDIADLDSVADGPQVIAPPPPPQRLGAAVQEGAAVLAVLQPRPPGAPPVPRTVEGVPVTREDHGMPGEPGSYMRYMVVCPRAGAGHRGALSSACCAKRRNNGPKQTVLGPNEPLAFLGVWLQARDRFAERSGHMQYVPAAEDVRAYMVTQGWL